MSIFTGVHERVRELCSRFSSSSFRDKKKKKKTVWDPIFVCLYSLTCMSVWANCVLDFRCHLSGTVFLSRSPPMPSTTFCKSA